MANKGQEDFWALSMALKYDDRVRGQPQPKSVHRFGWRPGRQCFSLSDDPGFGLGASQDLPVPVELAEAFLERCCLDKEFNQLFFNDFYPSQIAEDTIEVGGASLKLQRGKAQFRAGHSDSLPGLSLSVVWEGKPQAGSLHLFYQLRANLGRYLRDLAPDQIRANLRASVTA